eukprot:727249-Hanusia_phi.AAC.2
MALRGAGGRLSCLACITPWATTRTSMFLTLKESQEEEYAVTGAEASTNMEEQKQRPQRRAREAVPAARVAFSLRSLLRVSWGLHLSNSPSGAGPAAEESDRGDHRPLVRDLVNGEGGRRRRGRLVGGEEEEEGEGGQKSGRRVGRSYLDRGVGQDFRADECGRQ